MKGILLRTTVTKGRGERYHKGAFHQLRSFIEYKTRRVGVRVIDGAYTSQQCSVCGFTHSDNRPDQAAFRCLACGHTENADINAARNIAARAAVNRSFAVCSPDTGERLNRKPRKSMAPRTVACPDFSRG
ncbi:MAG: zinc ribbon domain-containing protein [Methanomicrobiales archaeon]|nr:zinc ribbon domain-containing protein [Methanomicrobiales archaeon]MDI6875620.1 zinc ribbon domain-containing protein [Methanomicrobiales archaeon]